MKKIKIGISFYWSDTFQNLWGNGAGQNMYFLKELLSQIDFVEDVFFVYWRSDISTLPESFILPEFDIRFYDFNDIVDEMDILIEGTLTLEEPEERIMHEKKKKVISYRMGNDFFLDLEAFTSNNTKAGRSFNDVVYDDIWVIPNFSDNNKAYLEIMKDVEIKTVPHLWYPIFLEKGISKLQDGLKFGYQKGRDTKMVSIFEPNINVVKSCYIPILITEQAYKVKREVFNHIYVCNTYTKKDIPVFNNFISRTRVARDKVLSIEKRHEMPYFLSKYTDIVVSHQIETPLNYAYYEALYGGYPLIHNSELLPEGVGYYYPKLDAYKGAEVLLDAMLNHDNNYEEYINRANIFLESISPYNQKNILEHRNLILRLLKG